MNIWKRAGLEPTAHAIRAYTVTNIAMASLNFFKGKVHLENFLNFLFQQETI